jgi:S1-C subfamily serine protease
MSLFRDARKASASALILLFAAGLLVGGFVSFYINFQEINSLNDKVSSLQSQVATITGSQNVSVSNQTITVIQNGTALDEIYDSVKNSVVLIMGVQSGSDIQGSGFVYDYSGRELVITNYHVVYQTTNMTVTFSDGDSYPAEAIGTDAYADLAVVSVDAPSSEFKPLEIVSSSSLRVGDQVIAIGAPYGLVGSLTTGVVSAVGRTIEEEYTNFAIPNIIQTSTPINPGNSGGPLLNALGNVVGITTAIVESSQGLGFAVPSNTILREVASLVATGTYSAHSYLGITGQAMTYALAQSMGTNTTYGWRVETVVSGGPSDGKLQTLDIITAMNGTTIINGDDLASYLEANTLPGQNLKLSVIRDNASITVDLILGTRPAP